MNIQHWQKARQSRDARFDGLFYIAVKSTGIYCRPICPAPTAHEKNVTYYQFAHNAAQAGFRPCIRCRLGRAQKQQRLEQSS
jgi:AraC family transcriptional regulator, regulatory protein of adaptative response / DNA-3-methyladenine glycosylase II